MVCTVQCGQQLFARQYRFYKPEMYNTTDSNGSNKSASGLSRIHPSMTMAGMTKRAVCWKRKKRERADSDTA